MNHMSANVDLIKICFTQNKTRININADVSVKNRMIGVFVKIIIYGILVRVVLMAIRHVKLMNN